MASKSTTDETQTSNVADPPKISSPASEKLEPDAEKVLELIEKMKQSNPKALSQIMHTMTNVFISRVGVADGDGDQNACPWRLAHPEVTLFNMHKSEIPIRFNIEFVKGVSVEDVIKIPVTRVEEELADYYKQSDKKACAIGPLLLPDVDDMMRYIKEELGMSEEYENISIVNFDVGDGAGGSNSDNESTNTETPPTTLKYKSGDTLEYVLIPPTTERNYYEIRLKDKLNVVQPMGDKQYNFSSVSTIVEDLVARGGGVRSVKALLKAGPSAWKRISYRDLYKAADGDPHRGLDLLLFYSDWGQMLLDRYYNESRLFPKGNYRNGVFFATRTRSTPLSEEHDDKYGGHYVEERKAREDDLSYSLELRGSRFNYYKCFTTIVDVAIREFINERSDEELLLEKDFLEYFCERQLFAPADIKEEERSKLFLASSDTPPANNPPANAGAAVSTLVNAECCYLAFGTEGARLLNAIKKTEKFSSMQRQSVVPPVRNSYTFLYLSNKPAQEFFRSNMEKTSEHSEKRRARLSTPNTLDEGLSWRAWLAMISDGALPKDIELHDQHFELFETLVRNIGVEFTGAGCCGFGIVRYGSGDEDFHFDQVYTDLTNFRQRYNLLLEKLDAARIVQHYAAQSKKNIQSQSVIKSLFWDKENYTAPATGTELYHAFPFHDTGVNPAEYLQFSHFDVRAVSALRYFSEEFICPDTSCDQFSPTSMSPVLFTPTPVSSPARTTTSSSSKAEEVVPGPLIQMLHVTDAELMPDIYAHLNGNVDKDASPYCRCLRPLIHQNVRSSHISERIF